MKKKTILTSISFILVLTIIIVYANKEEDTSFQDDNIKQAVQENTLSMMIEQTAGAGDYKLETRSSWPTDGYVFNTTLSKCENGGELSWDSTNGIVTMTGNVSDKCYVYFDVYVPPTLADYCPSGTSLATCIKTFASSEDVSVTSIYHHDGSLENGISDGSYRYAGACDIVNNYVCFGSTTTYRIIGVINKNVWSASNLNTVNLNTNYLNNIGSTWSDKIASTTWKVAGNTYNNIYNQIP